MALVALFAAVGSACTSAGDPASPTSTPSATPSPVPVKVAFFEDLTLPGSAQVVSPSSLALRLALTDAAERGAVPVLPEVTDLDTEGDPGRAAELAREVAADPAYVAAVAGPFWIEPVGVGDILDAAGIPTLSLSGLDPSLADQGWRGWRRVVGGLARQVASLGSAVRGSPRPATGVCLVGDGSAYARTVADLLGKDLGPDRLAASTTLADGTAVGDVVGRVARSGCSSVAWTGFAPGATLLRTGLTDAGLGAVSMVGTDAMKTDAFLSATSGEAEGTIVTCACVDLASSTRTAAGRFIHDFQSAYGAPPGVYGAEGWDVGGMLIRALASGASDRTGVARYLRAAGSFEGLANTYRFAPDGELEPGSGRVHVFRAEGVRWVPVGEAAPTADLPVGTPGYLSMSACRSGRPFAYTNGGRLRGFDVELAQTIARRLGLRLAWSDLTCRAALRAVGRGRLDAVLAPAADVAQGTPTSRVALSLRVGLVTTRGLAEGARPLLQRLGPADVVAVVRGTETRAWAADAIRVTGATVELVADRTAAYRGVASGSFAAVADLEPWAWVAVERRPRLVVAQSVDAGADDVIVAKGPGATLIAAIDEVLGRLLRSGRYTLLFAKYFPGTPIPSETGS